MSFHQYIGWHTCTYRGVYNTATQLMLRILAQQGETGGYLKRTFHSSETMLQSFVCLFLRKRCTLVRTREQLHIAKKLIIGQHRPARADHTHIKLTSLGDVFLPQVKIKAKLKCWSLSLLFSLISTMKWRGLILVAQTPRLMQKKLAATFNFVFHNANAVSIFSTRNTRRKHQLHEWHSS